MKIFIFLFALSISSIAHCANTYSCFNVKDYGAVGNNSTDDTVAINSAIAAAGAATISESGSTINKGGCVYFPAGVYVVSSTITFPNRISVNGDGSGGVLGGGDDSPGASVVRGTMNATILYFPNDRFSLQNIGVTGPDNAAYTLSSCILVGSTSAKNFTISHIYTEKCYDGLYVDGVFNGKIDDVTSQFNKRNGIRALSAQGSWNGINVIANVSDGLYIGNGSVNVTASPWVTGLQTWDNGGFGVNVQANGFSVTQFFLNNDYAGEINVGAGASSIQISGGQIQYSGLSNSHGTNAAAPGIYIEAGHAQHIELASIQFFGDQGNDIDDQTTNGTIGITGSTFFSGGSGGVAGHKFAINSTAPFMRVANIQTDHPVKITGHWTQWSNSSFFTNSDEAAFNIAGGSNHILNGVRIYQGSPAAKGFTSATGTSYSLAGVQVFGGSTSLGAVVSNFNGTP